MFISKETADQLITLLLFVYNTNSDKFSGQKAFGLRDELIRAGEWPETDKAIEVLVNNGYVRHFWHEDDINGILKLMPYRLSEEQMEVVKESIASTSCEDGITWGTIENLIEEYGEDMAGKKFLLRFNEDTDEVENYYEYFGNLEDFEIYYADSLEEAEKMCRDASDEFKHMGKHFGHEIGQ